eukprot:2430200-Prymnesium_polylepis.1
MSIRERALRKDDEVVLVFALHRFMQCKPPLARAAGEATKRTAYMYGTPRAHAPRGASQQIVPRRRSGHATWPSKWPRRLIEKPRNSEQKQTPSFRISNSV